MILRETTLHENSAAGMAFSTGIDGRARYLILLVAVVLFLFSLSGETAYNPLFRVIVIVVGVLLAALVGPRSEVLVIRSERCVRLTTRFFLFSRSHEYLFDGGEKAELSGGTIWLELSSGQKVSVARVRHDKDGAFWLSSQQALLAGIAAPASRAEADAPSA